LFFFKIHFNNLAALFLQTTNSKFTEVRESKNLIIFGKKSNIAFIANKKNRHRDIVCVSYESK